MKLTWRGGRLEGNGFILIAAAAPRSLCAIRWAATGIAHLQVESP